MSDTKGKKRQKGKNTSGLLSNHEDGLLFISFPFLYFEFHSVKTMEIHQLPSSSSIIFRTSNTLLKLIGKRETVWMVFINSQPTLGGTLQFYWLPTPFIGVIYSTSLHLTRFPSIFCIKVQSKSQGFLVRLFVVRSPVKIFIFVIYVPVLSV